MQFPLKPKPGQLEFAKALLDYFSSPEGVLLAEGYNGLGKTIASIWALRESGRRGLVAVRTYEEAGNFYNEARRLGLDAAVLLSKRSFCSNPRVALLPADLFYPACLTAYKSGACGSPGNWKPAAETFRGYVEEATSGSGCPFLKTLRYSRVAHFLVVTYPYVTKLRDRVEGLFEGYDALVYDEAHNLIDYYVTATALYPADLLRMAKAWRSEELRLLAKHLQGRRMARGVVEDAAWALSQMLGVSVMVTRSHVLVYGEPRPLLKEASVFMSGFIPRSIERLLREFGGKLRTVRVEAPESLKVKVLVVEDLDSSYDKRRENVDSYRELVYTFSQLKGRKAVFYASKRFKKLVGVPDGAIEPDRVFEPPCSPDYLIADVLGGRLAEGSNVPFDAILIAGFPYAEIDAPLRFVLNTIKERHGEEVAWGIYEDSALCKVVQAIGRLTRTGGWAIVADSRVLKYRLPSWCSVEKISLDEAVRILRSEERKATRVIL